jgi:hypothetical protein
MPSNVELEKLASDVIAVAGDIGAMVVDAVVSFDGDTVPVASVAGSDFLDLLKHVRPKIAYVFVTRFDAQNDVMEALEAEDDAVISHITTKKLISAWRHRNGEISSIALALMCDGVLHAALVKADWLDDFEQAAEAATEEMDHVREEAERRLQDEERKKNSPYLQKLIADPRFSSGRPSAAKRALLAKTLFPNLDEGEIRIIITQAENEFWLTNAGRKV